MTTDNLWGKFEPGKVKLPATILKAQAAKLGQLTDNILQGRIDQRSTAEDDPEFCYDLDIIARALNDYIYTVVRVRHDIEGYPVSVSDCSDGFDGERELSSEDEFVKYLAGLLSSEHVRNVVNSLLTQSTDVSE